MINKKSSRINNLFEICEVSNQSQLLNTLLFLQNSFKWNKDRSERLFKILVSKNSDIGLYGLNILDKYKNICGALLIIYQGTVFIKDVKYDVVNLNSLYVSPPARGIQSIYMIKRLLKKFPDQIITEFTANKEAHILLKTTGFKDLKSFNSLITLPNALIRFLTVKRQNQAITKFKEINYLPISNKLNRGDSKKLELTIQGKILEIIYVNLIKELKILNLTFKIKGLAILYINNYEIFLKNRYKIILKIMLLKSCFFIKSHCSVGVVDIQNKNYHLAYTKIKSNTPYLVFGSELSYFL